MIMPPVCCFIHTGFQPYLVASLARASASGFKVYLLGDAHSKEAAVLAGVEFIDLESLATSKTRRFFDSYAHNSVNSLEYERFCFARWLYLYEFAKSLSELPKQLIYLDSDVLFYASPESLSSYSEANFYTVLNYSPSVSIFNGISHLEKVAVRICEFYSMQPESILDYIVSGQKAKRFKSQGSYFQGKWAGTPHLSDMDLLQECFDAAHQGSVRLLPSDNAESSFVFNPTISSLKDREICLGAGPQPVLEETKHLQSIHFQGGRKKFLIAFDTLFNLNLELKVKFSSTRQSFDVY